MAVLFYSPVHEVERLREIFPDVIMASSPEEAPPPPTIPVVIHGTGGTTQAVVKYLENSRGAVLVAFGEHNSLASALHTRAELEAMGVPSVLLTCERASECAGILKKAEKIAEAAAAVYGARVLLVGRAGLQAEIARSKFGWVVEVMPLEEFEKLVETSEEDVETASLFGGGFHARITSALRSLGEGRDAVAIQCFPYIMRAGYTPCLSIALLNASGRLVACEGDLAAALAMLISRRLTGYSGWIANVAGASGGRALFAHCTIALNMARRWRKMPHFETGRPYGLAAELSHNVYTAVAIGPRLDRASLGVVEVVKSGNFEERACRTQALVKIGGNFLELAAANHHVFIPGDVAGEVEAVLRLLGIRVVRYQ